MDAVGTGPAGSFPAATRQDWERAALESLKGRPLASLRGANEDGLPLEVLYWPEDVAAWPHTRLEDPAAPETERPGAWEIRQRPAARDVREGVAALEEAAARGQRRLPLPLPPAAEEDAWRKALAAAKLGSASLDILSGSEPARAARWLATLPAGPQPRVVADWLEAGLLAGSLAEGAASVLAGLWRDPAAPAAILAVGGVAAHEAGASSAQELGIWLAAWTQAVRELEAAGVGLEAILPKVEHELSASRDLFESLARLRAARLLMARWLEVAGVPAEQRRIVLGARGSLRHQTRRDPWVNWLRASVAGFAAAAAGVDFLHLPTYAEGLGSDDPHARRIAANIQVILQEEAQLARVADPARGSGLVEALTAQLAEAGWARFQELEAAGGLAAALAAGLPQRWAMEAGQARRDKLAKRRETLVGTSAYPNLKEALPAWAKQPQPSSAPGAGLRPARLAEELEALRDRGTAAAQRWATPVWLAAFGPLKQHKARADFSRGFVAVAGLSCGQDGGQPDPAAAAAAAFASGAPVVVCCSTDDTYPEWVGPFVAALRSAETGAGRKASRVLLAGHPADQLDALRAAGVEDFIHVKASLPAVLFPLVERLEVTA